MARTRKSRETTIKKEISVQPEFPDTIEVKLTQENENKTVNNIKNNKQEKKSVVKAQSLADFLY